jgi:hypothetical protein
MKDEVCKFWMEVRVGAAAAAAAVVVEDKELQPIDDNC